jgi:hypothetical protein
VWVKGVRVRYAGMFLLYLVNWTLEAVTGAVFRAVVFLPCSCWS